MKRAAILLLTAWPALAEPAGSATCRPCHLQQWTTQKKTGHANALSQDGKIWKFGSGSQAITPVSRAGPESYLEHGLTKYSRSGENGLTPGHKDSQGVRYEVFSPGAQILRCFQCHSTGGVRFDVAKGIDVGEKGVTCEACHGPSADHVRAGGGRSNIFQPRVLNAAAINDFCGNCHRKPPEPGEDTNWTDPWNTRHQPLGFSQSACFRKSEGRLTCFTCHDPHGSRPTAVDACSSCHPSPRHLRALAKTATCTGCHMPAVKPSSELRFTNHWIGIYRPGSPLLPRR